MRSWVGIGLLALALGAGCGHVGARHRPAQAGFAEAERLLYPYTVARTVDGHRRLGQVIRRAVDPEVRAAACYHYLRSSLDVAALAFYPIAAADGRPDRLLPLARMVRRMPLQEDVARACAEVTRSLPIHSAWSGAWSSLSRLVETLSAGRRGGDVRRYHEALRQLAQRRDWTGLRARFHLVGGCLASYFTAYKLSEAQDPWAEFAGGCGYVDDERAASPPSGSAGSGEALREVFDQMASELRQAIRLLPEDPFAAFARHQLATVVAVRQLLGRERPQSRLMARAR